MDNNQMRKLKQVISPNKHPDKQFFHDFKDHDRQMQIENDHLNAVLTLADLKIAEQKGWEGRKEKERDDERETPGSDKYKVERMTQLKAQIKRDDAKVKDLESIKVDPYFARADLYDEDGGYNSYYIGYTSNTDLEIVGWESPFAKAYYASQQPLYHVNGIDYHVILRRVLELDKDKVKRIADDGPYLGDYFSSEELADVNETMVFDSYLKDVLKSRKEKTEIVDIIKTIQAIQYEIISLPASDQFVCQGVAGSGKTMVLLHRLAYLLASNKDKIQSVNVLVISPSDSYNDFIKGISKVLKISNLHTSTIDSYFMSVLKNAELDFSDKIDLSVSPKRAYLEYLYSMSFVKNVEDYIGKTYGGITKLIDQEKDLIIRILEACTQQINAYGKIKNSSIRVQSTVLGEITDDTNYSKPFTKMVDCIRDVLEFSSLASIDELKKYSYASLIERFSSFYKAICYLESDSRKICTDALNDLLALKNNVQNDLLDAEYGKKKSSTDDEPRSAQTVRYKNLVSEIDSACSLVQRVSDGLAPILYFAHVMHDAESLDDIGKCKKAKDVIEHFYNFFVLPRKKEYKVKTTSFMKCDVYTFAYILSELGYDLTPKYAYMFIDEAQDISWPEYHILKTINKNAVFNIYGDLMQNITPFRGLKSWDSIGLDVYNLDINYRNTNEIVNYVASELRIDMKPVGVSGEPVKTLSAKNAAAYLSQRKGLKAIICSDESLHAFKDASYNLLRRTNKVAKDRINVMTVYESKGLEFSAVVVCDNDLSANEKYIAYTRALSELIVVHDKV
ncbi:MAG: UvrD-helicase domain-containing protein [Clostridia bacterium]|nr:UvrD-helicase domain-containing protein [Clostridia bacterium]